MKAEPVRGAVWNSVPPGSVSSFGFALLGVRDAGRLDGGESAMMPPVGFGPAARSALEDEFACGGNTWTAAAVSSAACGGGRARVPAGRSCTPRRPTWGTVGGHSGHRGSPRARPIGGSVPGTSKPVPDAEVIGGSSGLVDDRYCRRVRRPTISHPDLLALHAVRLKGMGADADVADRFGIHPAKATELLLDFQAYGWISRVDFAGTAGWTLTAAGLLENQRQLAGELAAAGGTDVVRDCYRRFLPRNGELQQACTDWQLRPTSSDPLAGNDHFDLVWDRRVLESL